MTRKIELKKFSRTFPFLLFKGERLQDSEYNSLMSGMLEDKRIEDVIILQSLYNFEYIIINPSRELSNIKGFDYGVTLLPACNDILVPKCLVSNYAGLNKTDLLQEIELKKNVIIDYLNLIAGSRSSELWFLNNGDKAVKDLLEVFRKPMVSYDLKGLTKVDRALLLKIGGYTGPIT